MEERLNEPQITLVEARTAKWDIDALLRKKGVTGVVRIERADRDHVVRVTLNATPPEGTELPTHMGRVPVFYEVAGGHMSGRAATG